LAARLPLVEVDHDSACGFVHVVIVSAGRRSRIVAAATIFSLA
jgi:hypothetical protein